jgi:hypothetical protein
MEIKKALTRALMNWLPVDTQERMAADVVAWLCADLPPAEQREKMEKLAPRLLERIRGGHIGLRLVVYYHITAGKRKPAGSVVRRPARIGNG